NSLKKVQRSDTIVGEVVPKAIVATIPNHPSITSFDFLRCKADHAIFVLVHVMEIVFVGRRKRAGEAMGLPSLIRHTAGLWPSVDPPCFNYKKDTDNNQNHNDIC